MTGSVTSWKAIERVDRWRSVEQCAAFARIVKAMPKKETNLIKRSLLIAGITVAFLWAIHLFLYIINIDTAFFGVVPRNIYGLPGILTSPLVHGDLGHLVSNSGPLFVLMAAMLIVYPKSGSRAMLLIYFMTGIWVWVAGHAGSHIGASGVVYGLAGFLFFSGIFRWDARSLALTLFVAFLYGGMLWGVLPGQKGISWESHLFGLVAGAVFAWYFRRQDVAPKKRYSWDNEPETDPSDDLAPWNYQKNWQGARIMYVPGDRQQDRRPHDS